jgi:hypothetical protein
MTPEVPEAALNAGFDILTNIIKTAAPNERKTAVRWFNRLYYDVRKWNEKFIKFLRTYPGFQESYTPDEMKTFSKELKEYHDGLDERYSVIKLKCCSNGAMEPL